MIVKQEMSRLCSTLNTPPRFVYLKHVHILHSRKKDNNKVMLCLAYHRPIKIHMKTNPTNDDATF